MEELAKNITQWYPFEDGKQYITIYDFSKEKEEELKKAIQELKDDGKILIMLNNRLSIKSICSNINTSNLYNYKEIEELLNKYNLKYRKFYYPLPDCETTNVIFTEKHLPDEETITRNIKFYKENEIQKNDENEEFIKLLEYDKNLFKIFANSYFIECSKNEFEDNNIEFVSFSNMRNEQYRIKTIIKGNLVYKQAANIETEEHIKQVKTNIDLMNKIGINTLDSYKDNVILSKYQKDTKTFDKIIIEKVTMKENDSAYKLINNFVEELKDKLCVISSENNVFDKYNIVYKDEDIKNLTFVKYGLWDAIFQNIFYIDNKFYFYDQEWFEENIPLEFIIYRAFEYSKKLKEIIDAEKIYNQFSISQENLNLFKILDNQLQLKTRSEESWKMHTHFTNISTLQDINSYKISVDKEKEKILEDCKKLLNEKDSRIKFLEDNMESTCNLLREKEEKLSRLENSVSWKLTKPLRKLKGLKK